MGDVFLYIGFVSGMIYGMVFVFISFVLYMRITQQLRQLLPQSAVKGETVSANRPSGPPPESLRSRALISQNHRFLTHEEYVRMVNGKTQPIRIRDTEQLN